MGWTGESLLRQQQGLTSAERQGIDRSEQKTLGVVIADLGGVAWEAGSPIRSWAKRGRGLRAHGVCALPSPLPKPELLGLGKGLSALCHTNPKVASSPEGCPGELDPNPGQRAQAGVSCNQL